METSNKISLPMESAIALAKSFLDEGKDFGIRANGNSMLPFIRDRKDTVILRRRSEIKEGDILLAKVTTGKYVIHRLIDIQGDSLVLKGDGNYRGVEHCSKADVVGTVVQIVKPGGKIISPDRGRNWHKLPLFVRRPVIAVYKRLSK